MSSLISVIVPVYNVAELLDKCINSIAVQTYKNIEIILVDDGSSDDSAKICDYWSEKDHRIKVVHKKNEGISSARNCGLEIASGEYIMFVDSDDWISNDAIQVLYDRILSDDSDIVIGQNVFAYPDGTEKILYTDWMYDTVLDKQGALERMSGSQQLPISVWGKLFKTQTIKDLKFPPFLRQEDLHFLFFALKKSGKISIVSKTIYYYWQRSDSIMHSFTDEIVCDGIKAVLIITKELLEANFLAQAESLYNAAIFYSADSKSKKEIRKVFLTTFSHKQRKKLLRKDLGIYCRYFSLYLPFIAVGFKCVKEVRDQYNLLFRR